MRRSLVVAIAMTLIVISFARVLQAGEVESKRLDRHESEIAALRREVEELKKRRSNTGYDHGFFIRSSDDNYELKVTFYAQPYYQYEHLNNQTDAHTFGIRRARLKLAGHIFTPDLTYRIEPEMTTNYQTTTTTRQTTYTIVDSGGDLASFTDTDIYVDRNDHGFRLRSLYAQYRVLEEFQIRAGLFKLHTEYFDRYSNYVLFNEMPIIALVAPFNAGYHMGVDFLGTIVRKIDYELFVVNGANNDRFNVNKALRAGVVLTFNILKRPEHGISDVDYSTFPRLSFTVSGDYSRAGDTTGGRVNVQTGDDLYRGQTNLIFQFRGFAFVPEFIYIYDRDQGTGYYGTAAQTSYFIIPEKFEIGAGASWLRYPGQDNDVYEFTGGLNYYFFGQPVKMMLDYSYQRYKQVGSDIVDNRIQLGAQIGFF